MPKLKEMVRTYLSQVFISIRRIIGYGDPRSVRFMGAEIVRGKTDALYPPR